MHDQQNIKILIIKCEFFARTAILDTISAGVILTCRKKTVRNPLKMA
jgi:hypothetical protein